MALISNQLEFARAAVRQSLRPYVVAHNPRYQFARVHEVIVNVLERVQRGELKRVILNMPPRHGKSELVSVNFPPWLVGIDPTHKVLAASYGQELASTFGRQVRQLAESPLHKALFPECNITKDSNASHRFDLTKGGGYRAVGVGGTATGLGADTVIIDDPHKGRKEAESAAKREEVWQWYLTTIYLRLSPEASVIVVATRWNEDDLCGRLIREQPEEGWVVIDLAAICEREDDLMGRKEGEALWPGRWPLSRLLQIKANLSAYDWSAIYQQRPTPLGGGMWKAEWLRYYRELPPVRRRVWSWDTAIKTGQMNDYSVGLLWAVCDNGHYLERMVRKRLAYPDLKAAVINEYAAAPSSAVLVEDKSSGQQLLQELGRNTQLPLIGMMPGKDMPLDKILRVNLVSPMGEAGKVWLPEGQPWVKDVVDELTSFPNGPHDDIVDATTQHLARELMAPAPRVRQL